MRRVVGLDRQRRGCHGDANDKGIVACQDLDGSESASRESEALSCGSRATIAEREECWMPDCVNIPPSIDRHMTPIGTHVSFPV